MKVLTTRMEKLDRISFDIPRSLLQDIQTLSRQQGHTSIQSFMQVWLPRMLSLAKNWQVNDALVNDIIDRITLQNENEEKERA